MTTVLRQRARGRVEQGVARRGIGHELHQPAPDHGKIGHGACRDGELTRDFAEPVRNLHEQLHAEIVGGRGLRRRCARRSLGDRLQRVDQLRTLAIVLQDFERLLRLRSRERARRLRSRCTRVLRIRRRREQDRQNEKDESEARFRHERQTPS